MLPFEPALSNNDRYASTLNHRFYKHGSQYKIISRIGYGKRVLDVGCATGYIGEILRAKKRCYVVGIEANHEAATIAASRYDQVLEANVEQINSLPFPENFFDVLLCSDVLEHLRRPDLVLVKLKPYLSRKGELIAVIPNIGYFPARMKILMGQFEYDEIGHFDKTHLRFFTLKTAKQLINSTGYRVLKVAYTGPASILPIFPTWLAMKFMIIAQPC